MSIALTWMGTASWKIETQETELLVDPFVQLPGGEHPNSIEDFLAIEHILITHGHFDHLYSIPQLAKREKITVYCTRCPETTLEREGVGACVRRIGPGEHMRIGNVEVTAYQGKHIHFDAILVLHTLQPHRLNRCKENTELIRYANPNYPENGEILIYELQTEGKRIQIMGSLGLDEHTCYPVGADVLVLPYQGRTSMVRTAKHIVKRLCPKRILLSHFDDAFPPVSSTVDTAGFEEMMKKDFPDIKVIKPNAGKPMAWEELE